MSDNFIIEDFPMSQVEFEKRFSTVQACIDYLAKMKWPDGFCCRNCGHRAYWISAKHLYICTRCESFGPEHLQSYLDEYVFRFNRRTSRNIGKEFMRIAQQVTSSTKVIYKHIVGGASPYCLLAN